jgi:hypothetical protein
VSCVFVSCRRRLSNFGKNCGFLGYEGCGMGGECLCAAERMTKILLFDSQVHEAGSWFHIAHLVFQMLSCSWLKYFLWQ